MVPTVLHSPTHSHRSRNVKLLYNNNYRKRAKLGVNKQSLINKCMQDTKTTTELHSQLTSSKNFLISEYGSCPGLCVVTGGGTELNGAG